jgi:hypothetical protein
MTPEQTALIERIRSLITDDEQLSSWVEIAMDYNRAVTGGHP